VFIFALIAIAVMYWIVGAMYVETSREIKRFDVSISDLHSSLAQGDMH